MDSNRQTILSKILRIDAEINDISSNKNFRKLKGNLKILEDSRSGSRKIVIGAPDDMERNIELRRNSEGMRNTITEYKALLDEYRVQLNRLHEERSLLEKQLFPS
ncbi:hypothetical protein JXL21_12495 [Candidatus Bathyarchaeota archaeon]|nr:hypothetical protein [Candidatus Bathyarchaeota archaeon]